MREGLGLPTPAARLSSVLVLARETRAMLDPAPLPLPVRIRGCGSFVPEHCVTNAELEHELGLGTGWIERATGVRERRRGTHDTTLSMAVQASTRALEAAGTRADELDLIVGTATAPHQAVPCTAALLQRALEAPDGRSACFDVNSTCLGFLTALQVASQLIASGAHARALVCASEVTRHSINPDEPESAVLLGDGAAAVVLERSPAGSDACVLAARFETHSSGCELTVCRGGGTAQHPNDPSTTHAMNLFRMDG